MDKKYRIQYLIEQLNLASDAYYGGKNEYISNYEWDRMFDELAKLENETGIFLPNSPTQMVSHPQNNSVNNIAGIKERHEFAALSLAKTKNIVELQNWASDKKIWLSWKLDGLTLVLTYDNGMLTKILTRGDGVIGTDITYMKDVIKGFPTKVHYQGHMVVRGEALILYSDFEKINMYIDDENGKYANPRNLASGTLALDPSNVDIVRERNLRFYAFSLVYIDEKIVSWGKRMRFLDEQGFYTVERVRTTSEDLPIVIEEWSLKVEQKKIDIPVDGLVICYDDTEYATTGSITGHHATRAGLAFKWQDEVAITTLNYIEWSCAASVITPVAVFEPVRLEGTSVTRASLCNISELERLGIGENGHTKIKIIKANKIIPKCVGVVESEGHYTIPEKCPVCHEKTIVSISPGSFTKTLHCTNIECPAKRLRYFVRFVSRPGMDIEGLSIKTILLFINKGYITNYESIYSLSRYIQEICELEGFGDKSCKNLLNAIERSKKVDPVNFIYALGIPLIGLDAAKRIIKSIGFDGFRQRVVHGEEFDDIIGIGKERSNAINRWFDEIKNKQSFDKLTEILDIEDTFLLDNTRGKCTGLTFVITGDVNIFSNRADFIEYVESQGGKVVGSVSNKTSYLINNNKSSASSKNKKAKKLGISIISENEFIDRFGK